MIVDRYYYAQLNKQEQAVYKAFYNGLMAHEDVIPIPIKGQLSKDVYNKIFRAMTTVFLRQGNSPKVQS